MSLRRHRYLLTRLLLIPFFSLFFFCASSNASFRFFKSLWTTTTTTTTTTTANPLELIPSSMSPISSVASSNNEPLFLSNYAQLNESYLAELASAHPNISAEEFAKLANNSTYHNQQPHGHELEDEDDSLLDSFPNGTLPVSPTFDLSPANISTYYEANGAGNGSTDRPPVSSDASEQTETETPFEVLIRNDKTMARLKFDLTGREIDSCTLYDIEKDGTVVESVPVKTGLREPLQADYKTILQAIRRCTELARRQLIATPGNALATMPPPLPQLNETIPSESPPPTLSGNSTSQVNVHHPGSNLSNGTAAGIAANAHQHQHHPPSNGSANSHKNEFGANFISVWKGIVPGTRWCGLGDSALDYHDLGPRSDIDLCCRAHDHCPIRLKAFRMGYGLINFSFYTKSHCDCDEDFYRCLKQSPHHYAQMIKNFYFNVLQVQCIKHESPLVCIKKRLTKNRKEECIQYEVSKKTKMKFVPFEELSKQRH